jgi:RNA polymerase sigma-70 factor (ECF subfamily)
MNVNPSQMATDLQAARNGEPDALGRALEACRAYLLLVAEKEMAPDLRAKGGASDLVQQTFLEAHSDFHQFRGDNRDELLAWLRALLANNLSNFHRHWRGTAKRDSDRERPFGIDGALSASAPAADTPTPSATVAEAERAIAVRRAMAKLPTDQQEVLKLRYELDLSFDDVAIRLGRTPAAARQLWARAVARLEAELGDAP